MADYDGMNPDKSRTDPRGYHQNPHFPVHLFKWAGEGQPNTYISVGSALGDAAENEKAKAKAIKAGWSETPVLEAPKGKE